MAPITKTIGIGRTGDKLFSEPMMTYYTDEYMRHLVLMD